jgi:hypothetical protein
MESGCYKMDFADYLADPCPVPSLSRSTIKDLVERTPAHAWQNHPRFGAKDEETEEAEEAKFNVGTAAHSLFLEGVDVGVCVDPADYPGPKGGIPKGWTTDLIRSVRDSIRGAGKIPMLPKQYIKVWNMVEAAKKALKASEHALDIEEMDREQTYIWKEKNGVWCRIRVDAETKDRSIVLDYKTTGMMADPQIWAKQADEVQESFYRRGVGKVDGVKPDKFIFMVQEDEPPYLCSFIELSAMYQDMGKQKVKAGIALWHYCTTTDDWPGYSKQSAVVDPPSWAMAAWEMKRFGMELERQGEI